MTGSSLNLQDLANRGQGQSSKPTQTLSDDKLNDERLLNARKKVESCKRYVQNENDIPSVRHKDYSGSKSLALQELQNLKTVTNNDEAKKLLESCEQKLKVKYQQVFNGDQVKNGELKSIFATAISELQELKDSEAKKEEKDRSFTEENFNKAKAQLEQIQNKKVAEDLKNFNNALDSQHTNGYLQTIRMGDASKWEKVTKSEEELEIERQKAKNIGDIVLGSKTTKDEPKSGDGLYEHKDTKLSVFLDNGSVKPVSPYDWFDEASFKDAWSGAIDVGLDKGKIKTFSLDLKGPVDPQQVMWLLQLCEERNVPVHMSDRSLAILASHKGEIRVPGIDTAIDKTKEFFTGVRHTPVTYQEVKAKYLALQDKELKRSQAALRAVSEFEAKNAPRQKALDEEVKQRENEKGKIDNKIKLINTSLKNSEFKDEKELKQKLNILAEPKAIEKPEKPISREERMPDGTVKVVTDPEQEKTYKEKLQKYEDYLEDKMEFEESKKNLPQSLHKELLTDVQFAEKFEQGYKMLQSQIALLEQEFQAISTKGDLYKHQKEGETDVRLLDEQDLERLKTIKDKIIMLNNLKNNLNNSVDTLEKREKVWESYIQNVDKKPANLPQQPAEAKRAPIYQEDLVKFKEMTGDKLKAFKAWNADKGKEYGKDLLTKIDERIAADAEARAVASPTRKSP